MPSPGTQKINVDASFVEIEGAGTTGLVIHDLTGALNRAQALCYENKASPLIMKALAIRDGIRLAIERGFQDVEIETGAQEVI
jgi:ribonuclease HI